MSNTAKKNEVKKGKSPARPVRTPLSQQKTLSAKHRPGYVRRYVNETLGRVEQFQLAGWTIVHKDQNDSDDKVQTESQIGSLDRIVVNRDPNATAKTAILMEIKQSYYDEDVAANQAKIDEAEKGLRPTSDAENYGELSKKTDEKT